MRGNRSDPVPVRTQPVAHQACTTGHSTRLKTVAKPRSGGTIGRGADPARTIVRLIAVVRHTVGPPSVVTPVDMVLRQVIPRPGAGLPLLGPVEFVDDDAADDRPDDC